AFFATSSTLAPRIEAAVVLDSVSAPPGSPIRIVARPDTARGTSPTLLRTARSVIARVTGQAAIVPGLLDQLSGLAIPYALSEQGPLLARGVSAITLTAGPPPDPSANVTSLDPNQLGQVGNATANLVVQLDGASAIEPGGRPAIFVGSRTVRGWLAEVALVALLGPALACVLDIAARGGPGGRPSGPRSRLRAARGGQRGRAGAGAAGRPPVAGAAVGSPAGTPLHDHHLPAGDAGAGRPRLRVCDPLPSRPLDTAGD